MTLVAGDGWGVSHLVCRSRMLEEARMKKVPAPNTRVDLDAFFHSTSDTKLAATIRSTQAQTGEQNHRGGLLMLWA
jgi:hypothetical protein